MSERALINNIDAWLAGDGKLDVRALFDRMHREFPDDVGPVSWAARLYYSAWSMTNEAKTQAARFERAKARAERAEAALADREEHIRGLVDSLNAAERERDEARVHAERLAAAIYNGASEDEKDRALADYFAARPCSTCGGAGWLALTRTVGGKVVAVERPPCPRCSGSGRKPTAGDEERAR